MTDSSHVFCALQRDSYGLCCWLVVPEFNSPLWRYRRAQWQRNRSFTYSKKSFPSPKITDTCFLLWESYDSGTYLFCTVPLSSRSRSTSHQALSVHKPDTDVHTCSHTIHSRHNMPNWKFTQHTTWLQGIRPNLRRSISYMYKQLPRHKERLHLSCKSRAKRRHKIHALRLERLSRAVSSPLKANIW